MNLLPKSIKIGGSIYSVEYCESFSIGSSNVGLFVNAQSKIKILTHFMGKKRTIQRLHETLLHEIMHGIDHIYCSESITEGKDIVERLSSGWYALLSNNDFKLRTMSLPKTVRLNNILYDIICPYQFNDDIKSPHSVVDYEACKLYITNKDEEGVYSPAFFKTELLWCLNYLIEKEFCLEDDSLKNTDLSFSNGLYQVLVENNLDLIFFEGARK
jgi:hypothetical protein